MADEAAGEGDGDSVTSLLTDPPEWRGPSSDPNDRQFGDAVERATPDDADKYDVLLVGEPSDAGVIGRTGAAEGPAAIRDSLAAAKTHHIDAGAVDERASVGDLGNVALDGVDDVATVQERVGRVARFVHGTGALPVFLGGDNSLTFANAAPLLDAGSVGALSFDAHLDCRAVRPDVGPTSGTPYRQLVDAGLDSLSVVGVRDFETSTAYHDFAHAHDVHLVPPQAVGDAPLDALDDAIAALGDVGAIYVSVDLDVLDAAAAPGVSAPTPGGLTTRELFRVLDHVTAHGRVAGVEVVECAPPLDSGTRTVDAAARAVAHVLASAVSPDDHAARREAYGD